MIQRFIFLRVLKQGLAVYSGLIRRAFTYLKSYQGQDTVGWASERMFVEHVMMDICVVPKCFEGTWRCYTEKATQA